jgi:uncharacterized protein YjbJ (UPF0337 family)
MDPTKDILQGKWPELKDQVQQKWSKLTDEDIARLSGKAEELASVLRLRYRYGRIEADMEIRNWLRVSNKKAHARA